MENRTWLIKMERCEKHVLTLFDDGYVVDNCGKKLFVLKKSAMELVRALINEYSVLDEDVNFLPDCTIKCNIEPRIENHNRLFFNQMVDLLFAPQNIKHPDDRLGPIIDEIECLRGTGKLQEMLKSDGEDGVAVDLINRFSESR